MSMPELLNKTGASASVAPCFDRAGDYAQVVILKQAFALGPEGRVEPVAGAEILHADVLWDAAHPDRSSVRFPSDFCAHKPSTDVVVLGRAVSPGARASTFIDVSVRVGPVTASLRAHGPRGWVRGVKGVEPGAAQPVIEVPLRWELAWGGSDFSDPQAPLEESRNPVGRGVSRALDAALAHQLEFLGPSRSDGTRPACFGAIAAHWSPRREYAGTHDARWMAERMPLPPVDQDERFYQVAPPWMIAPTYLQGGEPVELIGMHRDGPIQCSLPRRTVIVRARRDREVTEHRALLDTVILDADDRRLELVWRVSLPERTTAGVLRIVTLEDHAGAGHGRR